MHEAIKPNTDNLPPKRAYRYDRFPELKHEYYSPRYVPPLDEMNKAEKIVQRNKEEAFRRESRRQTRGMSKWTQNLFSLPNQNDSKDNSKAQLHAVDVMSLSPQEQATAFIQALSQEGNVSKNFFSKFSSLSPERRGRTCSRNRGESIPAQVYRPSKSFSAVVEDSEKDDFKINK